MSPDEIESKVKEIICNQLEVSPEQLRPEALLERAHLERDGGLGHPETVSRLREAAALDDGAERRKLTGVHKRTLSVNQKTPRSASQCSSSGSVNSGPRPAIRTSAFPISPDNARPTLPRRRPRNRNVSSAYSVR